jgi:hypothetical protein
LNAFLNIIELSRTANFPTRASTSELMNVFTCGTFVLVVIVAEKEFAYRISLVLVHYFDLTVLTECGDFIVVALQIYTVIRNLL